MTLDNKTTFAVIAMLINAGCFINYVRSILQHKTKPHAYTWLIWCITQGTAVAAIWYGNGGWGAWALIVSTIFVALVFLLSLRYGTRNITRSDTAILFFALLAIVVWWQLDNPYLAVAMVSIIDVIGYIPSWRKSISAPWSEAVSSWIASPVGYIFAMLALMEYNFLTLTYPVLLVLANLILVTICLYYRRTIPKPLPIGSKYCLSDGITKKSLTKASF